MGAIILTNNPRKSLDAFLQNVEAKNMDKAMTFVLSESKPKQKNKIHNFLQPWIESESVQTVVKKDEAWREKKTKQEDLTEKITGFKPTPRYWAHYYHATVVINFDDIEETVIIEFERVSKNTWNPFSQLFKPWMIVSIHYPSVKKNADIYEDISSEVETIQDSNNNENINAQ